MSHINYRSFFAIVILTTTITSAFANESTATNGISAFLSSDGNGNGFGAGFEHYYLHTPKYRITGNVSLYSLFDPGFSSSAELLLSHSVRRTWKWGLFVEYGLVVGYEARRYAFDLYKTNNDGDVVNIGKTLTHAAMLGNATGFGYDFSKVTKFDIQPFVKFYGVNKFPNNDNLSIYKNSSIMAGVTMHPKWLR